MRTAIIPVTAFAQNCSLVWCEATGAAAVIDPGGDIDRILATVREQDVRLEKILLTHAHIDHAGATQALAESQNAKIVIVGGKDGLPLILNSN